MYQGGSSLIIFGIIMASFLGSAVLALLLGLIAGTGPRWRHLLIEIARSGRHPRISLIPPQSSHRLSA